MLTEAPSLRSVASPPQYVSCQEPKNRARSLDGMARFLYRSGMFQQLRASWDLKRRLHDVEDSNEVLRTRLKRLEAKQAEDVELIEASLAKIRGRITGGVRHQNGETEKPSWEEIDRQIREGTYSG